jgi:hypothetical protein
MGVCVVVVVSMEVVVFATVVMGLGGGVLTMVVQIVEVRQRRRTVAARTAVVRCVVAS